VVVWAHVVSSCPHSPVSPGTLDLDLQCKDVQWISRIGSDSCGTTGSSLHILHADQMTWGLWCSLRIRPECNSHTHPFSNFWTTAVISWYPEWESAIKSHLHVLYFKPLLVKPHHWPQVQPSSVSTNNTKRQKWPDLSVVKFCSNLSLGYP
jgi:hypothetical protein